MRRSDAVSATGDMLRRAAGWHAPRPADEDLRDLAELLLRARDEALIAHLAHQLAAWCRFATSATAAGNMVHDYQARAARGDYRLRVLPAKALGFHRCWSRREPWAWLACR
jgi:hypothetical protein